MNITVGSNSNMVMKSQTALVSGKGWPELSPSVGKISSMAEKGRHVGTSENGWV